MAYDQGQLSTSLDVELSNVTGSYRLGIPTNPKRQRFDVNRTYNTKFPLQVCSSSGFLPTAHVMSTGSLPFVIDPHFHSREAFNFYQMPETDDIREITHIRQVGDSDIYKNYSDIVTSIISKGLKMKLDPKELSSRLEDEYRGIRTFNDDLTPETAFFRTAYDNTIIHRAVEQYRVAYERNQNLEDIEEQEAINLSTDLPYYNAAANAIGISEQQRKKDAEAALLRMQHNQFIDPTTMANPNAEVIMESKEPFNKDLSTKRAAIQGKSPSGSGAVGFSTILWKPCVRAWNLHDELYGKRMNGVEYHKGRITSFGWLTTLDKLIPTVDGNEDEKIQRQLMDDYSGQLFHSSYVDLKSFVENALSVDDRFSSGTGQALLFNVLIARGIKDDIYSTTLAVNTDFDLQNNMNTSINAVCMITYYLFLRLYVRTFWPFQEADEVITLINDIFRTSGELTGAWAEPAKHAADNDMLEIPQNASMPHPHIATMPENDARVNIQ